MENLRKNRGFSLIEVVISIGMMGLLVMGIMQVLTGYSRGVQKARELGIKEDFKEYVRQRLDCVKTAQKEHMKCGMSDIQGYDKNGNPIIIDLATGLDFDGAKLKLGCSKTDVSLAIDVKVQMPSESGFEIVTDVPIVCDGKCGVPIWTVTDPILIPPNPLVSHSQHLLPRLVKGKAKDCGIPYPFPDKKPIRRSWGASKVGTYNPFHTGTLDTVTLNAVCNMFGYDEYTWSTCVEPQDERRCNFSSPDDNYLIYHNGSKWKSTGKPVFNMSWIAQIECSGYNGSPK